VVSNYVQQISRTFGQCEKLIFRGKKQHLMNNNLIPSGMVKMKKIRKKVVA
jgi:hypothetical protein